MSYIVILISFTAIFPSIGYDTAAKKNLTNVQEILLGFWQTKDDLR
jgi:hypothetical protein